MTLPKGRLTSRKNKQSKAHKKRAQMRCDCARLSLVNRGHSPVDTSFHYLCPQPSLSFSSQEEHPIQPCEANCNDFEASSPEQHPTQPCEANFNGFEASPITQSLIVLSLFDGISTTLHALDNLQLHVAKYFSSEIDEKALRLQRYRFGDRITPLGSVTEIYGDKLKSLGRIDLLVGGSPCLDLTRLNPARQGLNDGSTGVLFENFVSIRDELQVLSKERGHNFYWLLENTAHMDTKNKNTMCRQIGSEPVIREGFHFLPPSRKRFFWGNIPQMDAKQVKRCPTVRPILGDLLSYGRYPNVEEVPTLTTNSASQRSGKSGKLPVLENGKEVPFYIVEVESLFGFPKSYTDGPNFSITDRWKLLGKAFSVPVIEDLLRPLTDIFWQKPSVSR